MFSPTSHRQTNSCSDDIPLPNFPDPEYGVVSGCKKYRTIDDAISRIPRDANCHLDMVKTLPVERERTPYDPNRLAKCITTNGGQTNYHPSGLRNFSPRERASLQTFRNAYKFVGSSGEVNRQVGNAVPPMVWRAFVGAIMKTLDDFAKDLIDAAGAPVPARPAPPPPPTPAPTPPSARAGAVAAAAAAGAATAPPRRPPPRAAPRRRRHVATHEERLALYRTFMNARRGIGNVPSPRRRYRTPTPDYDVRTSPVASTRALAAPRVVAGMPRSAGERDRSAVHRARAERRAAMPRRLRARLEEAVERFERGVAAGRASSAAAAAAAAAAGSAAAATMMVSVPVLQPVVLPLRRPLGSRAPPATSPAGPITPPSEPETDVHVVGVDVAVVRAGQMVDPAENVIVLD
jgi:hypothetical protein